MVACAIVIGRCCSAKQRSTANPRASDDMKSASPGLSCKCSFITPAPSSDNRTDSRLSIDGKTDQIDGSKRFWIPAEMIDKLLETTFDAVADIPAGASVMIGGFGTAGMPDQLIDALIGR